MRVREAAGALWGCVCSPVDFVRLRSYSRRHRLRGPIFIVGCGHSGTTLLRVIVGRSPQVQDNPDESNCFYAAGPIWGASALTWVLRTFGRRPYRVMLGWSRDAVYSGAVCWVEKTPRNCFAAVWFRWLVPGSRVVAVVRDGRDVVASLMERGLSLDQAISRWTLEVEASQRAALGPNGFLLRYEDLVRDPEASVRQMFDFLGLEFSDDVLVPTGDELHNPSSGGASVSDHLARRNEQIRRPLFDGSGRWRQELDPSQVATIEERSGPLLAQLGY